MSAHPTEFPKADNAPQGIYWPKEFWMEGRTMDGQDTNELFANSRRELRAALNACVAYGLLLIVLPTRFDLGFIGSITSEIGIALFIAAILGFTIHKYMSNALVQDVFSSTLNHIFPPSLHSSIQWIYQLSKIATRSTMHVRIDGVKGEVVKVTCSMEREIKNISLSPQKHGGSIDIDEWGFDGYKSEILECSIEYNGKKFATTKTDTTRLEKFSHRTDEIDIKSNESSLHYTKWIEYKRNNDAMYMTFGCPTEHPEVSVSMADNLDLDCIVEFGSHINGVRKDNYSMTWRFENTFLPTQHIRIRWWPKSVVK